jgi:hypothetical protein
MIMDLRIRGRRMGGGFRGIGGFYMFLLVVSFGIYFRVGSFRVGCSRMIVVIEHSPVFTTRSFVLHIRVLGSATESGGQSDIWGFNRYSMTIEFSNFLGY